MPSSSPAWTPQRIELLREWACEFTAREIAEKFGGGVTRNAVIGKCLRMKIPLNKAWQKNERGPNWLPERAARRREQRAIKRSHRRYDPRIRTQTTEPAPEYVPPPVPADAPEPRNLTILDLAAGDCRYPVNEGPQYLFCGHAAGELPYCGFHARIAYQPSRPRR